ncbi:ATP binding cassette (ABC) protein subfamily A member [Diabrotica virgifera virgifera]|nr:ATP binding cassette (ABC) protein subfamily A member [Diabrotica virgifera virgifera]
MDLSGEGVNISNIWSGRGVPFGGSLIMMAVDIVVYGLLAYYLDSVIPSEYGIKRPPLFCFKLSFWFPKKTLQKIPLANGESSEHSLNNTDYTLDVEPVPREMRGREAIKIVDLYKTFQHCQKPEIKAVNGINLTIYEGHITAILGHNGAGKTTLFNILTGLTAPSAGTAYIFGHDVRDPNDMDAIRRMTGVCPQHDILFDNLSPREHLEFFAAVKGIHPSLIEFEVMKTLRDIDLTDKANSSSKHLSGGQKRKLSIGIAIIGDPKIVILDEPTAGVDPYSRRHMWSVLQNKRHGRVILLTTHFMDEADILADRKAVVSKGNIRCCGSSLFLKNKFGIGYHLTLVLEGHSKENAINKLVITHVPKAEKARRHGRELSFILPHNAVSNFASLFSAIEQEINNKSSKLGISSYGVSMTTLEEVFLHLERDEETEEDTVDNLSKKIVRNRALSRSLSLQNKSTSYQSLQNESNNALIQDAKAAGDFETCESPIKGIGLDSIECHPNWFQTLIALLRLRILRLRRDIKKLYVMIFLPLGLAVLGLFVNSMETGQLRTKSLVLNLTTYPSMPIAVHNGSDANVDDFLIQLLDLGVDVLDDYDGNFSSLLNIAPHMVAFNVNRFDYPDYSVTVLYNDTEQHSLPIAVNLINNALYRLLTGEMEISEKWNPIQVRSQPFQQTSSDFSLGMGTATFTMGMIFALIPVTLATDMVYDREIKAKNQLRVNGLSFSLYFISYFIVLAVIMAFICSVLLLLVLLFKTPSLSSWPALTTIGILILFYCPSSILFSTCVSYIFDKTDSAQSIMSNVATFLGWIPFLLVMILGGNVALILHIVCSLLNTMYLPYAIIYFVQRVDLACKSNFGCTELTLKNYMTIEIVVMFVGLILHIPFWFFILLIVDIKKNGGKARDIFKFRKKVVDDFTEDANEASDIGENEDQDVKAERQKVKNLMHNHIINPPVVMVENLHKEYIKSELRCTCCKSEEESETTKIAVKSLSLAVDAGEVFGLLGHNGAGKTTTMKIITAEEAPTRGRGSKGAILTTHSMEEADALCSRVGIMVKGELRCLGSTQHLKNLYGAGYTLEMKLGGGDMTPTSDSGDRHDELREFISSLFPDAALQEIFADRLVFSVPQQSVPSLANCFKQLEKAKTELDIEEYSFSQTTLEQVFLKFAHESENDES